ncbi:MAG: ClpX C4-type zinc finger protein [Terriglobales bacterium]
MKSTTLHCAFCGKSQDAVGKLISSPKERPGTYICDECIRVCANILEDDEKNPNLPDYLPEKPPSRIPVWLLRMIRSLKADGTNQD